MTLPAGVVTATDVTKCDQSAISAPVMVFQEEPETVATTAFPGGAEGIRTPDPLTASQVLCRTELQPLAGSKLYQGPVAGDFSETSTRGASAHSRSRS